MKPPKCRFLTPILHPNINKLGCICLDELGYKWSPAFAMTRIVTHIQSLMKNPIIDRISN